MVTEQIRLTEKSNGQIKEAMPKTEAVAKAKRRRFTAAEEQRLLREVDACQGSGEIGALLRREGIYASYLTTCGKIALCERKQRASGELDGLAPRKRGPKPNPEALELVKLRREHALCWLLWPSDWICEYRSISITL